MKSRIRAKRHTRLLLLSVLLALLSLASVHYTVLVSLPFDSDLEDAVGGIDWVYYVPGGQATLAGTYYNTGYRYFVDPVWSSGKACNPYPGTSSVIRISLQSLTITSVVVTWDAATLGIASIIATDINNTILDYDAAVNFGGSGYTLTGSQSQSNVAYIYVVINSQGRTDTNTSVSCIDAITVNGSTGGGILVDRSAMVGRGDPARIYADRYEFDDAVISDSYLSWSLTNPTQSCWTYGSDGYFQGPLTAASIYGADGMPLPSAAGIAYGYIYAKVQYPEPVRVWFSFDQFTIDGGLNKLSWVVNDDTCGLSGVSNGAKNHQAVGEYADVTELGVLTGIPANHPGPAALDNLNVRGHAEGDTYDWTSSSLPGPGAPSPPEIDLYQPVRTSDLVDHTEFTDSVTGAFTSPSIISTTLGASVYSSVEGTVTSVRDDGSVYGLVVEVATPYFAVRYNNLETSYVRVGDDVSAGCIIGTAGPIYTDIDDPPAAGYSQFSYSAADAANYYDWTEWAAPTGSEMCGSTYRTENCITNNPNLKGYAKGWTASKPPSGSKGIADIFEDGVVLNAGAYLYQDLVLTGGPYYITIIATTIGGNSADILTVTLGDDAEEIDITPTSYESLDRYTTSAVTLSGPLYDDIYRLSISNDNLNSPGILVDHICLHDGSANYGTLACYFAAKKVSWISTSPTDSGWTLSGVTEFSNGPPGLYDLRFDDVGDYVSHEILLSGNASTSKDYFLFVLHNLFGPMADRNPADEIVYDLRIDDEFGTLVDIGDLTSTTYYLLGAKEDAFKFSVPAATTYDGDFIIEVTTDDLGTNSAQIEGVCITPTNGQWPGEDPIDYETPLKDKGSCLLFPTAPDISITAIADWFSYLSLVIIWIFSCLILPFVSGMYNVLLQIPDGIGLLGKYLGALYKYNGKWSIEWLKAFAGFLNDLFLWGLFVALNGLLGQPFIARLFDLWGYSTVIREGLWDIAIAILALLTSLARAIIALIDLTGKLFHAARLAFNTTDVQDLNLPVCPGIDDEAALAPLCWGLDAVNIIVNATPGLLAAGAIVAAVMSWFTINWTVRQLNDAAGDM